MSGSWNHFPRGGPRLAWYWRRQRLMRAMADFRIPILIALALVALLGLKLILSPWPVTTTLKHWSAAPNCAAARAAGLAPARRGQPGYYLSHDADGDGVACEPFRRGSSDGPRFLRP